MTTFGGRGELELAAGEQRHSGGFLATGMSNNTKWPKNNTFQEYLSDFDVNN